jgi:hypothetical protein
MASLGCDDSTLQQLAISNGHLAEAHGNRLSANC